MKKCEGKKEEIQKINLALGFIHTSKHLKPSPCGPVASQLVFILATSPSHRTWGTCESIPYHKVINYTLFSLWPHWSSTCTLLCLCKNTFLQTSRSLACLSHIVPYSPSQGWGATGTCVCTACFPLLLSLSTDCKGISFTPFFCLASTPSAVTFSIFHLASLLWPMRMELLWGNKSKKKDINGFKITNYLNLTNRDILKSGKNN